MPHFYPEQINELNSKCGTFEQNKNLWFLKPGRDSRGNGEEQFYGVSEIRYLNRHGVTTEQPAKVEAVRPLTEQAYFVLLTLDGPGWSHLWHGMIACEDVEANDEARVDFETRMALAQSHLDRSGAALDADGAPFRAGQVYQLERGRAALVSGDYEYASADFAGSGSFVAHRAS